jgi:hypothetical protein
MVSYSSNALLGSTYDYSFLPSSGSRQRSSATSFIDNGASRLVTYNDGTIEFRSETFAHYLGRKGIVLAHQAAAFISDIGSRVSAVASHIWQRCPSFSLPGARAQVACPINGSKIKLTDSQLGFTQRKEKVNNLDVERVTYLATGQIREVWTRQDHPLKPWVVFKDVFPPQKTIDIQGSQFSPKWELTEQRKTQICELYASVVDQSRTLEEARDIIVKNYKPWEDTPTGLDGMSFEDFTSCLAKK